MNWDALGATAEIIGALLVLISLLYIAVQVRDTKVATLKSVRRDRNEILSKIILETPEIASAFAKVSSVDGQNQLRTELQQTYNFTPEELELYYYYLAYVWRNLEIDFSSGDHQDLEIAIERRLNQPTFRKFINSIGHRFSPSFMEVVSKVQSRTNENT